MTEEDPVAWLRAQIEADAARPVPPRDRLVAAVSAGDLSVNDARWVQFAADQLAADREMKLAILDEHAPEKATFSGYEDGWGPHDFGCRTCARVEFGISPDGWCRTVRLLASGYKHWSGYREEDWRPAP